MSDAALRIAVCDDEAVAVSIIEKKIRDLFCRSGVSHEISAYTSGLALRDEIAQGAEFEILFLDVDMPDLSGIRLGEYLRELHFQGYIIFISSQEQQVFDSLRVSPFRFIRKRKFNEEIGIVIDDLLREMDRESGHYIMLKRNGSLIRVNPYHILYAESQRKLQYVHTASQVLEINSSFGDLMEELKDYGFIQIHKSYFVNYRFIHSIEKTELILDNKESLPVSRQRLKEVKLKFQELSLHF